MGVLQADLGIGFLEASQKGKFVLQKSLSETPFKPGLSQFLRFPTKFYRRPQNTTSFC